jgi:hypothetical protein
VQRVDGDVVVAEAAAVSSDALAGFCSGSNFDPLRMTGASG